MAVTDPFIITHQAKQRVVDVQGMSFKTPTNGDISLFVDADTWLDGGVEADAAPVQLKKVAQGASFDQLEIVDAFLLQASAMGLTLTAQQIGQLITGAVEQAVRIRYED